MITVVPGCFLGHRGPSMAKTQLEVSSQSHVALSTDLTWDGW